MNNKNIAKKRNKNLHIGVLTIWFVLIIYTLVLITLLSWGFLTSLKHRMDFGNPNGNILGLPDLEYSRNTVFKFQNYVLVFSKMQLHLRAAFYTSFSSQMIVNVADVNFFGLLGNSILYAGVGCVLLAITPAVMGYLCAKYKFKFSEIIYVTAVVVLMVPIVGSAPAKLAMLQNLGLYDSFLGNWLEKISFTGLYFLVFYAFFRQLSDTYIEAAEIDGASQMTVLLKIVMPLAIKIISSVMLLNFVSLWNDYQTALLYLPTHPTLAYGVFRLAFQDGNRDLSNVPARIAACMTLALPILILFVFLKNKLMGNVSMGGIKE